MNGLFFFDSSQKKHGRGLSCYYHLMREYIPFFYLRVFQQNLEQAPIYVYYNEDRFWTNKQHIFSIFEYLKIPIIFHSNTSDNVHELQRSDVRVNQYSTDEQKDYFAFLRSFIDDKENESIKHQSYIVNRTNTRKIKPELIDFAKAQGYKEIFLEHMTIKQQIDIFSNANKIICLHGSGLTNMIFSNPQVEINEIGLETQGSFDHYKSLSILMNKLKIKHNYKFLGKARLSEPKKGMHSEFVEFDKDLL